MYLGLNWRESNLEIIAGIELICCTFSLQGWTPMTIFSSKSKKVHEVKKISKIGALDMEWSYYKSYKMRLHWHLCHFSIEIFFLYHLPSWYPMTYHARLIQEYLESSPFILCNVLFSLHHVPSLLLNLYYKS